MKKKQLIFYIIPSILIITGLIQIWHSLYIHSVDHQGHIGSSILFWRGNFHEYIDHFFMGYVQNLFYPPLNDLILGGMIKTKILSVDNTYRLYISIVWVLINISLYGILKYIKQDWLKILAQISFLLLFINGNALNLEDQGLSFQDFLVFGLTPQFLSFIFLIEWAKIILSYFHSGRWKPVAFIVCTTGILLSHLVSSLVIVTCFVFYIILFSKKMRVKAIKSFLLSIAISLFFWGPFLYYKPILTTSLITNDPKYTSFISILLVLAFIWKYSKKWSSALLYVPVLIFIAPAFIKVNFDFLSIDWFFPDFHYYRFGQYSNWVFLFTTFILFSNFINRNFKKRYFFFFLTILTVFFYEKTIVFGYFYKLDRYVKYDTQAISQIVSKVKSNGRIWAKHLERAIDTTIPQIAIRNNLDAKFTKGLFWETSLNNQYLANFLMTLGGLPTVLAGISYDRIDLNEYACFQRMFIEDFGITHILAPDPIYRSNSVSQMPKWREQTRKKSSMAYNLMETNFVSNVNRIKYKKIEKTNLGYSKYALYKNDHIDPNAISMLETIRPDINIIPLELNIVKRLDSFKKMTMSRCTNTLKQRDTLIANIDRSKVPFVQYPYKAGKFKKVKTGVYELESGHEEPTLNLIKLSYLPFWKLQTSQGEIALTESWPGMLGIWNGKATLSYQRSWFMKFCYLISMLALLFGLILLFRARNKEK